MRGSTNLSRFSGKTCHVYCGRESCHASMALSRWVATRANQRATATGILLVEMSCHTLAQSICKWKAGVSEFFHIFLGGHINRANHDQMILSFFFRDDGPLSWWRGPVEPHPAALTIYWSTCSARTAIYKIQVAKFASPLQVLLS